MKKLKKITEYLHIDITKEPPSIEEIDILLKNKKKNLLMFANANEVSTILFTCFLIYFCFFSWPFSSIKEITTLIIFIALSLKVFLKLEGGFLTLLLFAVFVHLTYSPLLGSIDFTYLSIAITLSVLTRYVYSLISDTIFFLECGIERLQPISELNRKREYERYLKYSDKYSVLHDYRMKVEKEGRNPIVEEQKSFFSYHNDLLSQAKHIESQKEREIQNEEDYVLIKEMMVAKENDGKIND